MADNATTIFVDGREVRTLKDILPQVPDMRILFVAKTPAPVSVKAGHYFQGKQGRMFWNRLKEYDLLRPATQFEDDSLVAHAYGITDIVKVPHGFGDEPTDAEYSDGLTRILDLIRHRRPKVLVFVYKRVLDQTLRFGFNLKTKANYGFNPALERFFGTKVFAFPLPGTPCIAAEAESAMNELVLAVGSADPVRNG